MGNPRICQPCTSCVWNDGECAEQEPSDCIHYRTVNPKVKASLERSLVDHAPIWQALSGGTTDCPEVKVELITLRKRTTEEKVDWLIQQYALLRVEFDKHLKEHS